MRYIICRTNCICFNVQRWKFSISAYHLCLYEANYM